MTGYKGMNKDMKCHGMQYEVGKSYHVEGKIIPCKNGIHFCECLNDVFPHYPDENDNRFFEVEASGTIIQDRDKYVTSDITIKKELDEITIDRYKYGYCNGCGDGYGNGCGNGSGYSYGNGYGYGNIYRIILFE